MIEQTLSELGLSKYETQVYLYLVREGAMGAVELSKKCGVPFGRIYDVLYQLELKGFVKVIIGKPKTFAAIEPEIALEAALKRIMGDVFDIEKGVKKDKKELEKIFRVSAEEKKPSIWISRGRESVRESRIRELVAAKKDVLGIVSSDVSTGFHPQIERIARESERRGVKRRFIENPLTKDDWKKVRSKIKGGAKIKLHKYKGFTISIVDEKLVRIEVPDPFFGRTSIIIENLNLGKFFKEVFEWKWKNSSVLKT